MDMQYRHVQAGRDVIEQSTLARALLARITNDITASVGPAVPTPLVPLSPPPASAAGGSIAPATGAASASSDSSSSLPPPANTPDFNLALQGDSSRLTLYSSRLPRELAYSRTTPVSDLRLITYWLAQENGKPLGLARREFTGITADDANAFSKTTLPNDPALVIAEEVKSLAFRYFSGSDWTDQWDGTQTGADLLTPVGPPSAIEIQVGIVVPSTDDRPVKKPSLTYYRHVVAIPTANGQPRQTTDSGP
jgi:hypothetical protein